MLQNAVFVAIGGALGALARFGVYEWLAPNDPHRQGAHGPGATILVNLIGCLLLGLILGWVSARGALDERLRSGLTIGLLGAFTTFSTYAGDALRLIHEERVVLAIGYLMGSMVLGLGLCAGGYAIAIALGRTG